MAQQRRKTSKRRPRRKPTKRNNYTLNWVGVFFVVVGGLALFRLGMVGTILANCFRLVVGNTFLFAILVLTAFGLWLLITGKLPSLKQRVSWGALLTYVSILPILSDNTLAVLQVHSHYLLATWRLLKNDFALLTTTSDVGGGMVGSGLYAVTTPLISAIGTVILFSLLAMIGLMIVFGVQSSQVFSACAWVGHKFANGFRTVRGSFAAAAARLHDVKNKKTAAPAKRQPAPKPETPTRASSNEVSQDDFTINGPASQTTSPATSPTVSTSETPQHGEQTELLPTDDAESTSSDVDTGGDPEADYELPSLDLLSDVPPVDQSVEYDTIKANSVKLKQTLDSFGVDVTVKSATLGPSITQYEIQPAVGVKVSKILNLSDDLALALAARDIRIEAPIPGKSLIGIEVPNQKIATVGYKELIQKTPPHPGKPLVIPLGKDVNGKVVTFDLTKMPHLLIAGATGSGKSVMINVIITSILLTTKPTEVRLMLIDPKRVELSVYNGVPHLLTPVVTEAKKAPSALGKVVSEMEDRYERFSAAGVRNIGEYNQAVAASDDPTMKKLPFIVVIVDELSDLMMVAGNEVETALVRLGQMARAAGIHVIIATQRPSVDVITGLIKANIPSRIAFAVSSGVDSRTILDSNGAEKLLGRGDMLFAPMGGPATRIQGAYISSADVEAVVKAITDQVAPAYEENMTPEDITEEGSNANSEDELYDDAKAFVIQQQSASTSMLQRRFRIGYNRAARLIDDLQANQIVGPSEGSKPRKVFAQGDQSSDHDGQ